MERANFHVLLTSQVLSLSEAEMYTCIAKVHGLPFLCSGKQSTLLVAALVHVLAQPNSMPPSPLLLHALPQSGTPPSPEAAAAAADLHGHTMPSLMRR